MSKLLPMLCLLFCLPSFSVQGATNVAASTSRANVQAAVNACAAGDTVLVPAGASTWTTNIIIATSNVTFRGSGIGVTVITDQANDADGALQFTHGCHLTGFTIAAADTGSSFYAIYGNQSQDFRVDNIEITNVSRRGFGVAGNGSGRHAQGVVDHCVFKAHPYPGHADGSFQLVAVQGGENNFPPTANSSTGTWAFSPGLGSSNAVFIEYCLWWQNAQGDSSCETYIGGKVVVRHCLMTNFFLGVHGNDSSIRSGHSVEVYLNTNYIDIGSDYPAFVQSRGGTGLVWSNEVHSTDANGNQIVLQCYRAAGQLAVDTPDYTLRFPYNMGQLDGHSKYDGNSAVSNGSGTHNGSGNASALVDTTKTWTVNQFYFSGTGATNDNLQSAYVWNRTDGSGGRILSNTVNTVYAVLSGGSENDWDAGDSYVITVGYPGLDQNGWAGPTVFNGVYASQTLTPWYQWGNTFNGSGSAVMQFLVDFLDAGHTNIAQPDSSYFIQANREYYNDTAKPGYVPFTDPHPLTVSVSTISRGAGSGQMSISGRGGPN